MRGRGWGSATEGGPTEKRVSRYSLYIIRHKISSSQVQWFTSFKTIKRSNGQSDGQTDEQTDGRTDRQAQTNMPPQLLRSWRHNHA